MKNKDLKSFDIASYDIEIEYNSKIMPIKKKIEKLNKNHEIKSLKSHKDFLTKEKQSKEKLTVLAEKAELKVQRIEKAVENKLIKLRTKDQRIKREFTTFKSVEKQASSVKVGEINNIIADLQASEKEDIGKVQSKYRANVKSYVEKLDTYNNNYENNRKIHATQIETYSELLDKKVNEIYNLKKLLDEDISKKLNLYLISKKAEDDEISVSLQETEKNLNNETTNIRKASNIKVKLIKSDIEEMKKTYEVRFNSYIENINQQIEAMRQQYEARKELIDKDLQINLDKLAVVKDEELENQSKNSKKTIRMKIELFNLRATTTIAYEERIMNEKIILLEQELVLINKTLHNEITNLEKLELFLLSDQNEIKDTGDYFKTLNISFKQELNNFELSNNEYLTKHEYLKTEFIRKYTDLFDNFKQSLLSLNRSSIDQLTVINQELDEINKYLDTSEPLKEIEVNKLRENIEVSEIKERYNIKYAKQKYEIKLLNNELKNIISFEEMNVKNLLSENNKHITDVKNKEILDKATEKAKLKHSKASEIYKLRLNNTKLERNILKSNYETELEVYEQEKLITRFEIQKNNILISKEISNNINNIETEAKYKIEVINKRLEEDLIKFNEQVSRLKYEQDAYSSNLDLAISKEKLSTDKQKNDIIDEIEVKFSRIDEALEREVKQPRINIIKSNSIIDERIGRLDINNVIFRDFITESTDVIFDENLSINQIKELVTRNSLIYEKSSKYLEKSYGALIEAIKFMNELEKRSILNKISSSTEQSVNKKLKKQLNKYNNESEKRFASINSSKKAKTVLIKNQIKADLNKLSKQKTDNIESLRDMVINIYESCFTSLKELQGNILNEITVIYSPLTKTDKEIIDNAELNSNKAKKLVEVDKETRLLPIDQKLIIFIDKLEEDRKINFENLEEQIREFSDNIDNLKKNALEQVDVITEDVDRLIASNKEQLRIIEESEENEIVKLIEGIDSKKTELTSVYTATLAKLKEKDDEAQKIYNYENRIFDIALETATSRYNDSNVKTENANFLNISKNNQNIDNITKNSEIYLRELNVELIELTKQFEKKIFITRPRLEESIGDAQKAIEKEIVSKKNRFAFLQDNHAKISQAFENTLYTSFQEGYEKLILNLNYYLEKYKVIGDGYVASNNDSNVVMSKNNIAFTNALFELGNKKHKSTQKKLLEINEKIT